MCDSYSVEKALAREPESVHRLTEGACPQCVLPLQQHEHPFINQYVAWTLDEWRFGLCSRCGKCWRIELQDENTGMVYYVTPRCHLDQLSVERLPSIYGPVSV